MIKNETFILSQIAFIQQSVAVLEAGVTTTQYIGGMTTMGPLEQVAFQRRRLALMEWIQLASPEAIETRRDAVLAELGPVGQTLIGGIVAGLDASIVERISTVEMLGHSLQVEE